MTPEITIIYREWLASFGLSAKALDAVDKLIDETISAEREACARVVEDYQSMSWCDSSYTKEIAAAIRERKT